MKGRSGKQLVAYYVPKAEDEYKAGDELTVEGLRGYLGKQLPDYMVPSFFMSLASFPLTSNGKLDRKALPLANQTTLLLGTDYVAPRNAMEEQLASIWREVLKRDRIGIHDNFFSRGGDSIVSIQVVSRAKRAGIAMTPKQLFQQPTIAQLSLVAHRMAVLPVDQGKVLGQVPLTAIQHYFFNEAPVAPHHYNQAFLFRLQAPLDIGCLEAALGRVIAHHDGLRLQYRKGDNGWEQGYGDSLPIKVERISLLGVSEENQSQLIESECTRLQSSFELSAGPLVRVGLLEGHSDGSQRLLIAIHHLVVDGVSWRILLEDLETAYRQAQAKQVMTLPKKTHSWKQWSDGLVAYAQTAAVEAERSYWLKLSEDMPRWPVDSEGLLSATAGAGKWLLSD